MKLNHWTDYYLQACQTHGVAGDTRRGKTRHNFRLLGKRVLTFEFRPYRWVFYRFEREAFLAHVDPRGLTKAPGLHEPGPQPCALFTGTLPEDDEALKGLIDRLIAAVASGSMVPVSKGETGEPGTESDDTSVAADTVA